MLKSKDKAFRRMKRIGKLALKLPGDVKKVNLLIKPINNHP